MDLGKYEIKDELGRGGFGTVYKAYDKALDRTIAIKVLHPNLVNDPTFLRRFRQEAQIAAQLDNPNLVPVYDFGESEGHYYIVMGYMPGGSLKNQLRQNGPIEKERALRIIQEIGSGLVYAHKRGVIHRDLKPGNILFDEEGKARVSDMGFAKLLYSDSSLSLSTSGGMIGTPAYMAPEIWQGKPATHATDIYSLACILVEMLTGKALFSGDSTPEIFAKIFEPLKLPLEVPEEWHDVVRKALDKVAEHRYEGVEEFVNALTDEQLATDRFEPRVLSSNEPEKPTELSPSSDETGKRNDPVFMNEVAPEADQPRTYIYDPVQDEREPFTELTTIDDSLFAPAVDQSSTAKPPIDKKKNNGWRIALIVVLLFCLCICCGVVVVTLMLASGDYRIEWSSLLTPVFSMLRFF